MHANCIKRGRTKSQLFDDDDKMYTSIDVDKVSVCLQKSRENWSAWVINWQLAIKIEKCAVLSVSARASSTSHIIL
jgi:hypothetical protein